MTQAKIKTIKNNKSVNTFLNAVKDDQRRKDSKEILRIMKEVTGKKPYMWGDAIVGFGDYHYKYETGREGDFFIVGFSPRKNALTIYIMPGYQDFGDLMKKLGPHRTGKSCLYVKKLEDIHIPTLKKIITKGYKAMV